MEHHLPLVLISIEVIWRYFIHLWKALERTLSEDTTTLSSCLQTRRLKLTHAETVTAAFHLHHREAKRELKVNNNGKIL